MSSPNTMTGTQASRKGLHCDQQYPHPHPNLGRKAQGKENRAETGYKAQERCLVGFLEGVDPKLGIEGGSSAWN